MGSSWSQNVTDYGLGSAGATLAARMLSTPSWAVVNVRKLDTSVVIWYLPPADTPDVPYNTDFPGPSGFPYFPYGIAVEPDVPV